MITQYSGTSLMITQYSRMPLPQSYSTVEHFHGHIFRDLTVQQNVPSTTTIPWNICSVVTQYCGTSLPCSYSKVEHIVDAHYGYTVQRAFLPVISLLWYSKTFLPVTQYISLVVTQCMYSGTSLTCSYSTVEHTEWMSSMGIQYNEHFFNSHLFHGYKVQWTISSSHTAQ